MKEEKKKLGLIKGCLIFIISGVILVVFGYFGFYYANKIGVYFKGRHVAELLEKQYGRKFVISDGMYSWQIKSYTFDVYAEDDPNIKFQYIISPLSPTGTACGYLYKMRRADLMKQLKPYVDAISDKNFFTANPGSKIIYDRSPTEEELMIRKNVDAFYPEGNTSIDVALNKYAADMGVFIRITYCYNINDWNKKEIFQKIYDIFSFIRDKKKFGQIEMLVLFYKPSLFDLKDFKDEGNGDAPYTYDDQKICSIIIVKDIDQITSPEDLNKHFYKEKAWRD